MKSIIIIIFIIIIKITPAFAIENDIGTSKIHPASPFYFLKGVREKLELEFAQTSRVKNLRKLEFAIRRLREARTLVNINEDLIPPTLERYISQLNSLPDEHQTNDEFAPILKNNLTIHLEVLQQIYAGTSNLRSRIFIRSAMDRIIQRADVPNSAKILVCDLFAKEAIVSADLNDTERVVLLDRSKLCFNSGKI